MATTRISCHPNAGLPNEEGEYLETPELLARQLDAVRAGRLAEHRRRLLRHDARAYPRARTDGGRPDASRRQSAAAAGVVLGHRPRGGRTGHPAAHRRRAHERHGLAPLQAADRGREVGRGERDRPGAGQARRTNDRRLPAIHGARRGRRCRPVLRRADAEDQGAGHDRHHRFEGRRARARRGVRARASSTRSRSRTAKGSSSASVRSRARLAPPSSSAPSTKMPGRRRRSRASESSRWPSARSGWPRSTASHPRTSSSTRSCFPAAPAMRATSAARSKRSKRSG